MNRWSEVHLSDGTVLTPLDSLRDEAMAVIGAGEFSNNQTDEAGQVRLVELVCLGLMVDKGFRAGLGVSWSHDGEE